MANITVDIKKKSIEIGSNLVAIGKGGMNPGVYDPQEIKADAFDMDNMVDGIDKHYLTTEQIEEFEGKQDALTAGDNIDITNNVISATDTTYTAGEGISIDENNVISNTRVSAKWGNIEGDIEDQTDLQNALDEKQDVLTAGDNVQIEDNVISATDTTYTAGQGISIDENNVISNTQTSAEWGNIQGDIEDQTDLQSALDDKQDVISDLSEIRSNATAGKDASDTIATYGDIVTHDADEFATADSVGEGVLTIQKNSTTVDTFSANAKTDKTINITVPTQASDIGALPDTTKYAANLDLSINSSTYVITAQLKDQDGNNLGTQRTIDLPLESVVVDGEYDAETKKIILTLENGNKIEFSVADLVSGLQTEITVDNKLDADLVDDATASHKFVTSTEKSCISTAVQPGDLATYAKCCDIPTDNCQLANGCGYIKGINCSDVTTALGYTPYSNTNPAGYTTCTGTLVPSDIENLAQCCDIPTDNCQLANGCGFTTCTGTLVASDIENLAQCCDIPTDNCQLANSCGYTTCTGTLVASDIENLAQCCDIPTDNCQLSNSCGYTTCTGTLVESDLCGYQKTCNMVCNLTDADNDHYPTAKAVADAMACAGVGDMLKSVYDPCGCEGDAFNACNMYNMPHIPTDNCELSNSCGFTTCTGTLVESDLACYAKCADIPTNNCQLTNGCGYIKGINCSDVTTALGYTPYNNTNPAGYTTCTGTLVASDIENLAQCCDIPTDNCQLANSCNFATCCYVNDSINSVTAYYITKNAAGDQFATYAELSAATTFYSGGVARVPTRNDYTIVLADENYDNATTRYIYNNGWQYQYTVNETPLTQEQLDALNSGITCSKVSCYDSVASTVSGFGDIVSCDASDFATPSDIPTDNCQLANGCGYTTCTGTLVPSDLNCYAKCADIPTNNCQLTNGCGYIKGINCSDVTTALGFTPYNSTNPAGYTTCTGTLVASDIEDLAQCCDIPTDNSQLANGCGYTTCTGTLVASDIEDLAQCCDIPTDNSQLANSCGYTTCTGTLVPSDLNNYAKCCDIPTNNNQLTNGCGYIKGINCSDVTTALGYTPYNSSNPSGYTTCTGTLVQSDLNPYAKCCDIPTNNCQLSNGCGYIKGINCSDVTTALGFTPYSNANPAGYTTCTGTLVASDIQNLAQCCDIPTDNCQLSNSCGYTTCTGTLNSGDLKTVNGCSLVGSGDICIQGGGGIDNLPGSPICICYKWTGSADEFSCLGTYRCDTEYNVIE